MRRFSIAQWALLALLLMVFIVLRMPASVFGAIVSNTSGGQLKLVASDGTLWHGSAQPLLNGAALGEQIRWDWAPRELLHGRLGYQLDLDGGQAQIALGMNDFSITDANMDVAAYPIFSLDKRSRSYGLTGQLHVGTPTFRTHAGKAEGTLNIDWRNAGSNIVPSISPLGDYHLSATPATRGWSLQLSTISGRLMLNGSAKWSDDEGLSTNIGMAAAPGSEAALAPFLNQIGPGAPSAERHLKFTMR